MDERGCVADYGNEKEVGAALADAFKQGLVKREEMFITTKVSLISSSTQSVLSCIFPWPFDSF